MVATAELWRAGHGVTMMTGFWRVELDVEWVLLVNGTDAERDGVPAWHATVLYCTVPIVLFNAATGLMVPGIIIDGLDAEAAALAAIERATAAGSRHRGAVGV